MVSEWLKDLLFEKSDMISCLKLVLSCALASRTLDHCRTKLHHRMERFVT